MICSMRSAYCDEIATIDNRVLIFDGPLEFTSGYNGEYICATFRNDSGSYDLMLPHDERILTAIWRSSKWFFKVKDLSTSNYNNIIFDLFRLDWTEVHTQYIEHSEHL
jgi:hypothetical protein